MTDATRYPLIESRGFQVCRDNPTAPSGILPDELHRVLTKAERNELAAWAGGLTRSANGMPLKDLEDFLSRWASEAGAA